MDELSGYLEVEHTADRELQVWAPDLPRLFIQAAQGMAALAGFRLADTPRIERRVTLQAADREGLLVRFLTELLFISEHDAIAFDRFQLVIAEETLTAIMTGAPVESVEKEIKAVTFHNLVIQPTQHGLQVNIIFDV